MKPRITALDIRQFRAIRNLSLDPLGRVNLITGRNNTGKSSVLEAFHILASNASLEVISEILEFREEWEEGRESVEGVFELEGPFPSSSLFYGFPQLSKQLEPVVIASRGRDRTVKVSLTVDWFLEDEDSDGNSILVPHQPSLFGDAEAVPALTIEVDNKSRVITFDRLHRSLARRIRRTSLSNVSDQTRLPCLIPS